jgi:hypothetical protein
LNCISICKVTYIFWFDHFIIGLLVSLCLIRHQQMLVVLIPPHTINTNSAASYFPTGAWVKKVVPKSLRTNKSKQQQR